LLTLKNQKPTNPIIHIQLEGTTSTDFIEETPLVLLADLLFLYKKMF